MKRFEFKKKFIESELPPKNTDVYWIDTNENSTAKDILSIKEYVNGEWKNICGSNSNNNNTGYDNFIKLDEGYYFLKTSKVQVLKDDTVRSLQMWQNTIEENGSSSGLSNWKDLYEYDYTTNLSRFKIEGVIDDAKILSNLNNSYKSKYYLSSLYVQENLGIFQFPDDCDLDSCLKEVKPLFNFKTSYLKLGNGDQSKVGSCKIFVYCKEQGTVNELDITIGITGTDENETFVIFRTSIDPLNLKSNSTQVYISTENLANDDEPTIVQTFIKIVESKDIYENQCVYNPSTKKIDVTEFSFMGWGSKTSNPVPMQYWIYPYDAGKKPELGLYYRCTPTESPTEISDYLKSNNGVSLADLTVTKLYLPKYNKCFYLIDNTRDTDIDVGIGEYKECDVSTKFDANW